MIKNAEWYRIFLHAAETENLTSAARKLHLTQPSVSYAIKQLEDELGVKLFDRLSKGVRLTQEGSTLYQHVKQAFAELEQAERHLVKLGQLSEGKLRIGANGAIVRDYLLPALDVYHDRFPDIRIQLSQERTSRIIEQLKQGILDIGYVYLPVTDEEVHVVATYDFPYCAVVGASFAEWAKQPLSAEQLASLPLLMLSSGSSTRSFIEDWFQSQGLQVAADFELNSLEMLTEFAIRGYGAAFLPRAYVTESINNGTLIELPLKVPLPSRQVGVAMRRLSSPSLASEAFLEILSTHQVD